MPLWSAFLFGLLGSLHCIGMCGPIVLALPGKSAARNQFVMGRFLYNIGRTITYGFLGIFSGWIGQTIALAGYQSALSIALGVMILIMIFLPSIFAKKLLPFGFIYRLTEKVRIFWGKLFKDNSVMSLFVIGLLNGFLPCGLVYYALAASASTASVTGGIMYMIMFGLGTLPALFVMGLFGKIITLGKSKTLKRLIPIGGTILAVLIILRGMSLGIPYVSPKVKMDKKTEEVKVDCCGHKNAPADSLEIINPED